MNIFLSSARHKKSLHTVRVKTDTCQDGQAVTIRLYFPRSKFFDFKGNWILQPNGEGHFDGLPRFFKSAPLNAELVQN